MSKVYVVQNQHHKSKNGALVPRFDIEAAKDFGEIEFLLSPTAKPFSPDGVIQDLHEKLKDYSADDYIVLIGNPALIGFTVAIASRKAEGKIRVLQWNGRRKCYIPIEAVLY